MNVTKDLRGREEVVNEKGRPVDRTWTKPTLERLSLKRALMGSGMNSDLTTGSAS